MNAISFNLHKIIITFFCAIFSVIILDETSDFPVPKICGTPYTNTRPILNCNENGTKFCDKNYINKLESHNTTSQFHNDSGNLPIQSQSLTGSHMSSSTQSSNSDTDHVTQSTSVKHLNVTCGNCGEKGHTRTFPKCSKYHTAEESARREVDYLHLNIICRLNLVNFV